MVAFFVSVLGGARAIGPRGIRLIVYTRHDSINNDPFELALMIGHDATATEPPVDLELYNVAGPTGTGVHYDPVWPASMDVVTEVPPPPEAHETPRRRRWRMRPAPSSVHTDAVLGAGSAIQDVQTDSRTSPESSYFKLRCCTESSDPRRSRAKAVQDLSAKIRALPTLPASAGDAREPDSRALSAAAAVQLPVKHCAFRGCGAGMVTEMELAEHIYDGHLEEVEPVSKCLPVPPADEVDAARPGLVAVMSAYSDAIAMKIREGAPLATLAIDRRSLYNYCCAVNDSSVCSLICWCCARRFPYVGSRRANEIRWQRVLGQAPAQRLGSTCLTFAGIPLQRAAHVFGVDAYDRRYGRVEGECEASYLCRYSELREWSLVVKDGGEDVEILCCPEDRRCVSPLCRRTRTLCLQCELPLCRECENGMKDSRGRVQLPPASLANDMMIFYAPAVLYKEEVTVMEMICASTCLTSMICFSLEKSIAASVRLMKKCT